LLSPASSADPYFNTANGPAVSAVNLDNDVAGIVVNPTRGLVTTEAGGTDSFTVVLTSQPLANVTIPVSSSDTTEGIVSTNPLPFTAANWNVPQSVTVTGVDDFVDDGNIAYTIVLGKTQSNDPLYNGVTPASVAVTNTDNDTAGIKVTPTTGL